MIASVNTFPTNNVIYHIILKGKYFLMTLGIRYKEVAVIKELGQAIKLFSGTSHNRT